MGFFKRQKTTEGAGRSEGSLEVVCPMRKFQKWERCCFPRNSYRYCIPELLSYFSLPAPFSHPPLRNSEQALPRICPKPNQDFPSPARLTPTLRLFLLFPFSCRIYKINFLFYFISFHLEKLVYPTVWFHFAASEPKISPCVRSLSSPGVCRCVDLTLGKQD